MLRISCSFGIGASSKARPFFLASNAKNLASGSMGFVPPPPAVLDPPKTSPVF